MNNLLIIFYNYKLNFDFDFHNLLQLCFVVEDLDYEEDLQYIYPQFDLLF